MNDAGTMPRLLYIGFNRSYTNATTELTLRLLGSIARLDYFGPGFSSPEELAAGVESWYDRNGPYDLVIVDSYIFEYDNIVRRSRPFGGDHIRFRPRDFARYGGAYQRFFLKFSGRKLFLANWDTFGIAAAMIERLVDSNAYVIESGPSFHKPKQEITRLYGSPYVHGNDNWYGFITAYRHKVISVPHFISSDEFDFSPIFDRRELFTVIGAPYGERKLAMRVQTRRRRIVDYIVRLRLRIKGRYIRSLTEKELLLLRTNYLSLISRSKLCYCSGGPWLYPVRKYFEIPARGAVAIGWPCSGFADLGFVDGKNFVVAMSNAALKAFIHDTSPERLQAIASEGRSLIWNVHSDRARAGQLAQSLDLLRTGVFKGSYWSNGAYLHYGQEPGQ